jgi:urate oxidase
MDHTTDFKSRSLARISESKCEEYLDSNNILYKRFGWDYVIDKIPGNQFIKLPETMRSLPDYIVFQNKAFFLEVKGCNDFLRLKICDMKSYSLWNMIMDLYFFIYSSIKNKIYKLSYKDMNDISRYCKVEVYENNNKHYYKIDVNKLEQKQKG